MFIVVLLLPARAQVSVLTFHNDLARTGANTNETILTLANVNANSFGLQFSRAVDDAVYAQPLVAANINVPGVGLRNLVLVATVNNSIYAFDADNAEVNAPYWQTNLSGPNLPPRNTDMTGACGGNYQDFHGNMGIVGTPVIDGAAGTLYVVARTKVISGGVTNYVQRLHALDLATGAARSNSPVTITATYPGSGDGNVNGTITFNPQKQNQRAGLTLVNGVVYLTWASHCDWGPYHGWLIGYSVTNLQRVAVYNATPGSYNGGIWQGAVAPAADAAGNLYFETGNGGFTTNSSNNLSNNFGDSVLKLSTTGGLAVADYFAPYNQASLDSTDADLGSGAAVLLPDEVGSVAHPHLLAAAGKEGRTYLLDRDNLGHFQSGSDSQIVQSIAGAIGASFGAPAYFNHTLYYLGSGDRLKAFGIANGTMTTTPVSQGTNTFGFPGATPSVSANGTNNGIVWALQNNAWSSGGPAILHAYNATNVALEIYNSSQAGTRDQAAGAVKFTVPTVANGKVYVGGLGGLSVFGNGSFVNTPTIAPNGGVFTNSVTVTLAVSTPGASLFYTRDGSIPTTNATPYSAPFVLTNTTVVKARAFKAEAVQSQVASATFLNYLALGHGTGLTGNYWSNQLQTFNGAPTLTRVDATVNFDWGSGSPDPRISADHFTARWLGDVQPLFSELHTFYTTADDGVRLWVNNQLIVDKWIDQSPTEWSGTLALTAGTRYPVKMEFYENAGGAVAKLAWSSPSLTKQIVPQSQLYPSNYVPPPFFTSNLGFANGQFQLQLSGQAGRSYVLQATTNFSSWIPLSTNVAPSTVFDLLDSGASNFPLRFYRALQQ